jgi:hypothetical protein
MISEKKDGLGELHNFQLERMLAVLVTERFGRSGGQAGSGPAHPADTEREKGVKLSVYPTGEDYPDFQESKSSRRTLGSASLTSCRDVPASRQLHL